MIEINLAAAESMFSLCRLTAAVNDIEPTDAVAGMLRLAVQLLGETSDPEVRETILSYIADTSQFVQENPNLDEVVMASITHEAPTTAQ